MSGTVSTITVDYLIIGSGIAGLSAAKTFADLGANVAVITKGNIQQNATNWAQGGIAAAMTPEDTPQLHFEDTIDSGDGLCDPEAVKILVEDGPERVRDLIALGANFDKINNEFSYAQEGAHSRRRILHAGDTTGREIEKTLGRACLASPNITFYPHTTALSLHSEDNRIHGCIALTKKKNLSYFSAKAIILSTGGCGQLFERNTNPSVATGEGMMLGYDIGCELQDMEFIQFHPTTLYTGDKKPISLFLISEAVRGEGALLRNIEGERFMPNYHEKAELAFRDVVSQAIFQECQNTQSNHVYLDLSHIQGNFEERFPNIAQRCATANLNVQRDFIPVAPAAHYCMGGLKTSINGETNVPGFYAAGEAASLGLHGANRLASNSLLDGLVFGHRAAKHAFVTYSKKAGTTPPKMPLSFDESQLSKALTAKQQLRRTMWKHVGIVRNKDGLLKAQEKLDSLSWLNNSPSYHPTVREVQKMLQLAQLITKSAIARTESRGAHFRQDFPKRNDAGWQHHIVHQNFQPCQSEAYSL